MNTHYTRGVRTVLVEGAVALEWGDQKEIRMKPGELADFDRTTTEVTLKEVDVTSYISWKEGYFVLKTNPWKRSCTPCRYGTIKSFFL